MVRKAGQALLQALTSDTAKKFGKKVAFDIGTNLAAAAAISALRPPIEQAASPVFQRPMTQSVMPEPQAAFTNTTGGLTAEQQATAQLERQRYLQRLSLIQAEKQPTTVVHENRPDLSAALLNAAASQRRYM